MQTIKFTDEPDEAQQAYLATLAASEMFALMSNLQGLEAPLGLSDNCLAMAIGNINKAMDFFWDLPEAELQVLLDYYGPAKVQAIFAAHEARASQLDAIRAQRGLPPMAKIGARREISVDPATGKFVIAPVPVPEVPEFPVDGLPGFPTP